MPLAKTSIMPQRTGKTWIETSKRALTANAAVLKHASGKGVKLMAVVKANAYGHGITETVKALSASRDVDWFGVDSLSDAEAVRRAGTKKPVLIMGYVPRAAVAGAVRQGFSLTVYDRDTIRAAARAATAKRPAKLHLKIETGTSRQGVTDADLAAFAKFLRATKNIVVEGVSTHYANIEDTTDPLYAMSQLSRFEDALKVLAAHGIKPALPHTAASAAAILYPQTRFAMVRTGIALYGLWPSKETRVSAAQSGHAITLTPALTWKSLIAQVKSVPEGTAISYGLTEKVTRDSRIAVVPVGYWDGFPRALSSVGRVLVRGKRAKVLGRVCMNMFVVDVTDIKGTKAEDEVVIIGKQGSEAISAEEFAAACGTINYEVIARINPQLPRVLKP